MSKLEELIQELCPNGVKYKTIADVSTFRRGSFPQPYTNSAFYGGEGCMPFVQVADLSDDSFELKNKTKQTISKLAQPMSIFVEKGTILVSIQGTIGRVAITQYDSYVDRTIAIFKNNECLNKKFFAYVLKMKFDLEKKYARGSTLKTITKEEFSQFKVPVPPMEVQSEIVRILDNFTLLTAELTAELTVELTARKEQYNYYKSQLLNFDETIKKICLSDIAKFTYGYTDKALDIGDTRYIRITDIDDEGCLVLKNAKYINGNSEASKYLLKYGDLVVARTGATFGKTLYYGSNDPAVYASFLIKIELDNSIILNRYYWHYSKSKEYWEQANKLVSIGGQQQFNANAISRLVVPVPSIDVQERIIKVLDNFDSICTDLCIGLPAEIEARQQQYEYYRNKLLTFKELK